MAAFWSGAFWSGAFDTGEAGGPVPEETGTPSFGIVISVVDPLVFASGEHYLRWAPVVRIGGVDVSARLTGRIRISGAEDAARIASFDLVPSLASDLAGYEGAAVTIDVVLWRTGQFASYRRFTGKVESAPFSAAGRVVSLTCRDAYQESIKACTSAAEVELLFGGLAHPSAALLPWSATEPDPVRYFNGLQRTMRGACFIDSNGLWRAVPWAIGTPLATFGQADVFDNGVDYRPADRSATPSAVTARLTHRYPRLHSAEIAIAWDAPERVNYVVDGLPTLPKSTVQAALDGLSDWLVKGEASIVQPIPGSYPVIVGAQTVYYIVSEEAAATICESLSATLYRRWYQEVEVTYSVTIAMGGLSDRDDSISVSLHSDFDSSAWEQSPSSESSSGIYLANAPTVPIPPTGYEGLPEPWPPTNGALDHGADITTLVLEAAIAHTVAQGIRSAASGKRQQRVVVSRPLDPRWEIGDVLGVNAYGVAAVGQVVAFEDEMDKDTGDVSSTITLACPDGNGTTTAFTTAITPPGNTVVHALTPPALSTHVGARLDTPSVPVEDDLVGFLCNCVSTSDNYSATKPSYQPQFRLVLPEIPAPVRDPLAIDAAITATYTIAGSGVTITF